MFEKLRAWLRDWMVKKFWREYFSHVQIDPVSGCWIFFGDLSKRGYPRFEGRLAYRFAWRGGGGSLLPGYDIHHWCENKLCVNVWHLLQVTSADHVRIHNRLRRRSARGSAGEARSGAAEVAVDGRGASAS